MFTVEKIKSVQVRKLAVLGIAAILFASCTQVYFTEPQPPNTKSDALFPKEIRGTYILEEDTVHINIASYRYPEEYSKAIHTSELDTISGIRIEGNLVYDDEIPIEEGIPYRILNDTLYYNTVLYVEQQLSENFQIKQDGNFMVVNQKEEDEEHWTVYLLKKRRNGNISIYTVGDFGDKIDKFFGITEFEKIGKRSYLVEPTKKEFRKLIKKGLFVKSSDLVKV